MKAGMRGVVTGGAVLLVVVLLAWWLWPRPVPRPLVPGALEDEATRQVAPEALLLTIDQVPFGWREVVMYDDEGVLAGLASNRQVGTDCAPWQGMRRELMRRLELRYVETRELTADAAAGRAYMEYLDAAMVQLQGQELTEDTELPEIDAENMEFSRQLIERWRLNNTLYDEFDGVLWWDGVEREVVAGGARLALIEQAEAAGRLTFHNAELRALMLDCTAEDPMVQPGRYTQMDQAVAVSYLREHPAKREVRLFAEDMRNIMPGPWMQRFEAIDHPADWQSGLPQGGTDGTGNADGT